MLLGELYRWGLAGDVVRQLLPHADRALAWIDESGDRDGDGFVEYQRATARGLANQGWKDSFDGVNFASGRLAEPPIALCEVQGYAYAAFLARADMARGLGDDAVARTFEERAATLKAAFNERFWLEDRGYFAMGLDGEKRPIDSLASNIGHCLWTGIADADKAARVAERLSSPEMFTGWGIRTLASSMGAYNPVSYHNGSVWPHDSAICAAGLARYGFIEEAHAVTMGLLDGGRVLRRATSRALLRVRPHRLPDPGALPDLVLAAGLGGRDAVPAAALDVAPTRSVGPQRDGLAGAGAARRHQRAGARERPAGRRSPLDRDRRRRGQGRRPAGRPRAHHRAVAAPRDVIPSVPTSQAARAERTVRRQRSAGPGAARAGHDRRCRASRASSKEKCPPGRTGRSLSSPGLPEQEGVLACLAGSALGASRREDQEAAAFVRHPSA